MRCLIVNAANPGLYWNTTLRLWVHRDLASVFNRADQHGGDHQLPPGGEWQEYEDLSADGATAPNKFVICSRVNSQQRNANCADVSNRVEPTTTWRR
jgi:hypothetical protein